MDISADLLWVLDTLSSARMEDQGRLLGIGALLDELREAVTPLHSLRIERLGGYSDAKSTHSVARLRNVLDSVLYRQARAEAWYQVPALSISNLSFRRDTARALRQLLQDLTTSDMWNHHVLTRDLLPRDEPRYVLNRHGLTRCDSINLAIGRPDKGSARNPDIEDLDGPMVGRAEVMKEMLKILLTDEQDGPLVVPIVGGPGIGKTRLAKALYQDSKFHRQLWLEVTPRFKLSNLHLNIRGSYLIVLDNLWNVDWQEWKRAMRFLPQNGKILLTTRTPPVVPRTASTVHTSKPCFLQPLDQAFYMQFLVEYDFTFDQLGDIGMMIAKKCADVPLLLKYTGLLSHEGQESLLLWEQALEGFFLEQAPEGFDRLNEENSLSEQELRVIRSKKGNEHLSLVLDTAYPSYQHLPSHLRSCFLCCSIFPLDYNLSAEDLADLSAAEGFIPSTVPTFQRVQFLQQLLDECFHPVQEYEHGDGGKLIYRMHKILHIFVQYMDRVYSAILRVSRNPI